jgi:hypothetical protein
MNVIVHNKKEVIMTETIITPEQALKSKKNFEEYLMDYTPPEIDSVLARYPKSNDKEIIKIIDLTQNIETLMNALNENSMLLQPPYIIWFVTNEKINILNMVGSINKYANKNFGIFIFKAYLNEDKIEFKCLLQPDLPPRYVSLAKQTQLEYWERYFDICDEMGSNMQINPRTQHWQYIPIGRKGVCLMLTTSTQIKYIGVDLVINSDKTIFDELYEHKKEIENELGELEWVNKNKNKSSKIRKTLDFDITDKSQIETAIKAHIELAENFKSTFRKYL